MNELFWQHAAPAAIEAHLHEALMRRDLAQEKVDWLGNLLRHREEQIKSGEWPSPRSDKQ